MEQKNKPRFKKVMIMLAVITVVVLCLLAYYYFTEVHKNKLCRTLDNLTREQIENISLLSQNGELAAIKEEDEIEEILTFITRIDAYGVGTDEWRGRNGGTVPAAFYIELKDGTGFFVGTDGVIDWQSYKVHSDWMLNHKLGQLYWKLCNQYSVPWAAVWQKIRLELVEDTLTDTGATFIVYNDSYYDIYVDGAFCVTGINGGVKPYAVDKTDARVIGYRSQCEITLDWSEEREIPEKEFKVSLYYITKDAGFGAYTSCEIKK